MTGVQTCALRSEEHTSELQSHDNLVCRLLLGQKERRALARVLDEDARARLGRRVEGARAVTGSGGWVAWAASGTSPSSLLPAPFFFLKRNGPRNITPFPPPALLLI